MGFHAVMFARCPGKCYKLSVKPGVFNTLLIRDPTNVNALYNNVLSLLLYIHLNLQNVETGGWTFPFISCSRAKPYI